MTNIFSKLDYHNLTDVEKNSMLDEAIKRYKIVEGDLDEIKDIQKKDALARIDDMLYDSIVIGFCGELLFEDPKKLTDIPENVERRWDDFLVLSARNYQKIIEIIEMHNSEEVISNNFRYFILLMSLFDFHNARRHAIAGSLGKKTLKILKEMYSQDKISKINSYLHVCLVRFLSADLEKCKKNCGIALNKMKQLLSELQEDKFDPQLYELFSIMYILQALKFQINYLLNGSAEECKKAENAIKNAEIYAEAASRADLKFFSRKLNFSFLILKKLSMWNLKSYLKIMDESDENIINEYISRKIKNKQYMMFISQIEAIENGLLIKKGNSVISMPTGSGKTLLAELLVLNRLLEVKSKNEKRIIVYLVPSRALAREKYEDFSEYFENGKSIDFKICQITGEILLDSEEVIAKKDLVIMTPEKFDMLLKENFYDIGIDTMVVDEFHNIRTGYRGLKLQFSILRFKGIENYKNSNIFLISAIVNKNNFKDIKEWIFAENPFQSEWRPTFTRIGLLDLEKKDNLIKFNDGTTYEAKLPKLRANAHKQAAIGLALEFSKKEPTLIFSSYVHSFSGGSNNLIDTAQNIIDYSKRHNQEISAPYIDKKISSKLSKRIEKLVGNEIICELYKKGIGLHWGALPHPIRKIVEDGVKQKALSILIATTTLAEGVNLPIKTIIIPSLFISNMKMDKGLYFNIIGRAGRPFSQAEGEIILICDGGKKYLDSKEITNEYYSAQTKDIEDIRTPFKSIFDREELIKKFKGERQNRRTQSQIQRLKRELKVFSANLESVLLSMLVEKLIDRIHSNQDLLEAIIIGKSNKVESERINQIFHKIEKRFVEKYKIAYYDSNNHLIINKLGLTIYKTGFSPNSCINLIKFLKEFAQDIKDIKFFPKNLQYNKNSIYFFKKLIGSIEIPEESISYFSFGLPVDYENILLSWMRDRKIEWIANNFFPNREDKISYSMMFMEGMLSGFSAWFLYTERVLLEYLYEEMGIEEPKCIPSLRNLPSYVWYGTTNISALKIMKIDISRELLRDDVILLTEILDEEKINELVENPKIIHTERFDQQINKISGKLKTEENEFKNTLYKILISE